MWRQQKHELGKIFIFILYKKIFLCWFYKVIIYFKFENLLAWQLKIFDVSPSGPGVLHPSPLTVFPSSHVSDPNRSPSPGPDQILVQKWTTLVTKSLCFWAISMRLFQLERSTFGPDRFWPKDRKTASIKRETKRLSKRRVQIREHLIYYLQTLLI